MQDLNLRPPACKAVLGSSHSVSHLLMPSHEIPHNPKDTITIVQVTRGDPHRDGGCSPAPREWHQRWHFAGMDLSRPYLSPFSTIRSESTGSAPSPLVARYDRNSTSWSGPD
jgi:hypothetical protein